jgi:hypothetical protein
MPYELSLHPMGRHRLTGEDVGVDVGVDVGLDVGVDVGDGVVGVDVGDGVVGVDVGIEVGRDVGLALQTDSS